MVGTIQMHLEEPTNVVAGEPVVAERLWVLEISTWDRRSMRVKFRDEALAHQNAVAFLTLQEQTVGVLDGIKRAGFDFEVVED